MLYGQEKDAATSTLARMNMILHDHPTALIAQGNTLTDPKFTVHEALKVFDYVVANPSFSDQSSQCLHARYCVNRRLRRPTTAASEPTPGLRVSNTAP